MNDKRRGVNSRNKGARYERDIAKELAHIFGIPDYALASILGETAAIKRELDQPRDGGADLLFGNLVFECKRRKSMKTVYDWMAQCVTALKNLPHPERRIPVVVMRADHEESLLIIRLKDMSAFTAEVIDE